MRRLITGLAVAGAVVATAAPAARADVTPEFFPLPAQLKSVAGGISVAPNGTVFFGAADNTEQPPIGRIDPALAVAGTSNGITSVKTPDDSFSQGFAGIRDVSFSTKDNTLYWTRSDFVVGRLDGDTATKASVPAEPWGIAAAPDGGAWLTENGEHNLPPFPGNRIARVSSGLGLTESINLALQDGSGVLAPLRYPADPKGIDVAPDGKPWFVEANAGNPGYRIGTAKGTGYEEWRPCPTDALCSGTFTGEALTDIVVANDGMLWYTNEVKRTIGRFDPSSKQYVEYSLTSMDPTLAQGTPKAVAAGSDGTIWLAVWGFSTPGANAIVKLVPGAAGPTATVYKLGQVLAPLSVATDTKGNVWYSGTSFGGPGGVGRLAGAIAATTPDPGTTTPITTPITNPTPGPTATPLAPVAGATAKITDPRVRGDSVTANQICVGPPQDRCSLIYLIQTHEYVTGFPNSNGYMAKAKKLTTIGTATVTLKGGQSKKVTIKLNSKGKKLRKIKGFKAILTVTQSRNGAKPKQILKKNVKFKK